MNLISELAPLHLGEAVHVDISSTPRVESARCSNSLKVQWFQAVGFKCQPASPPTPRVEARQRRRHRGRIARTGTENRSQARPPPKIKQTTTPLRLDKVCALPVFATFGQETSREGPPTDVYGVFLTGRTLSRQANAQGAEAADDQIR